MERWLSDYIKIHRQEWATVMFRKYLKPKDLHRVCFINKIHFDYRLERQLKIIQRLSTQNCHDCIRHQPLFSSEEKDCKRKHCWASIEYNFKSDIIFYDVPGNRNGKLTHQVYIDSIPKLVVKLWITAEKNFDLEDDSDLGHSLSQKNPVSK